VIQQTVADPAWQRLADLAYIRADRAKIARMRTGWKYLRAETAERYLEWDAILAARERGLAGEVRA
jgi:hypothetical protein